MSSNRQVVKKDCLTAFREARRWLSGIESYFTPLPEMTNDSADTLLRIVNKNSVYYSQPVDDIMFSAHQAAVAWETSEATNRTWYMSDTLSTTIGCLEQVFVIKTSEVIASTKPWIAVSILRSRELHQNFMFRAHRPTRKRIRIGLSWRKWPTIRGIECSHNNWKNP